MLACLVLSSSFSASAAPLDARAEWSRLTEPLFVAAADATQDAPPVSKPRRFSVSLYYADVEFDEIELDEDEDSTTLFDVPRERVGVQLGFGPGFARVYQEESDELEGIGFGLGARGAYVPSPGGRAAFLVDYEVSVDYGVLEEDDGDVDVRNLTLEGRLGAGVAIESFRAAAGLAGSFITGTYQFQDLAEIDLEGENFAPYVGLEYVPHEIPITARLDFFLGNIDGVALSIGYAF